MLRHPLGRTPILQELLSRDDLILPKTWEAPSKTQARFGCAVRGDCVARLHLCSLGRARIFLLGDMATKNAAAGFPCLSCVSAVCCRPRSLPVGSLFLLALPREVERRATLCLSNNCLITPAPGLIPSALHGAQFSELIRTQEIVPNWLYRYWSDS